MTEGEPFGLCSLKYVIPDTLMWKRRRATETGVTEEIQNNRKQRWSVTVAVIKLLLWLLWENHWKAVREHATEKTWT
jgi:hypothetical protein